MRSEPCPAALPDGCPIQTLLGSQYAALTLQALLKTYLLLSELFWKRQPRCCNLEGLSVVHDTHSPSAAPRPGQRDGGTQPAPPAKTRADPLLFTGGCYFFITVCSVLLPDGTRKPAAGPQRAGV